MSSFASIFGGLGSDGLLDGAPEGSVIYNNGTSWVFLPPDTAGYVLATKGPGESPEWRQLISSLPFGDQGDIIYHNGVTWVVLSPGDDGYVLTTGGIGANPSWESVVSNLYHGILTGLGADDHTQYLRVDGYRPMSADLDMDSNNLVNVGVINGVDITLHGSRHNPGGVDSLSTAAAGTISIGDISSEGTANSFARSDHIHALPTPGSPVNVDKNAASAGSSSNVARQDHKHDVSTAIAVSVGSINAEGTSISLARADHTHSVIDLNISGQEQGSILYFSGSNWVQLPPGDDGYLLQSNGTGDNPTWIALDHSSLTGLEDNDHPQYLLTDGSNNMDGDLDMDGYDINNVYLINGVDIEDHSSRHISGGIDEIDGDRIDVDFTPTYYTPTIAPPEVSSYDELTAHLAGIDEALNDIVEDGYFGNIAIQAGNNGDTDVGSYYRGPGDMTLDNTTRGIPVPSGTLISLAWTRSDSDSATLEVLVNGSVIAELPSIAAGATRDDSLNVDFNQGLMSFRNKSTGNKAKDVQILAIIKRRA